MSLHPYLRCQSLATLTNAISQVCPAAGVGAELIVLQLPHERCQFALATPHPDFGVCVGILRFPPSYHKLGLKKQEFILAQFWRLRIQDQGVLSEAFWRGSFLSIPSSGNTRCPQILGHQDSLGLCFFSYVWKFPSVSVSNLSPLQDRHHYQIQGTVILCGTERIIELHLFR